MSNITYIFGVPITSTEVGIAVICLGVVSIALFLIVCCIRSEGIENVLGFALFLGVPLTLLILNPPAFFGILGVVLLGGSVFWIAS